MPPATKKVINNLSVIPDPIGISDLPGSISYPSVPGNCFFGLPGSNTPLSVPSNSFCRRRRQGWCRTSNKMLVRPHPAAPGAAGVQVRGRIGGKGSAGPGEVCGAAKTQDGVCLTTVRRLRQEAAKKEELAVQQPRGIAPPFPDVRPRTCSSRARGAGRRQGGRAGCKNGRLAPRGQKKGGAGCDLGRFAPRG